MVCAQVTNLNWKGWGDSTSIPTFSSTNFAVTKAFNITNAENKTLLVIADDTSSAVRANDSINFAFGYELGTPFQLLDKTNDTIWSNMIPLDTFNMATANYYNPNTGTGAAAWVLDASADKPTRPHLQIDTTLYNGTSGMTIGFSPYWAPYIRFYVRGLTGNKVGRYLKVRMFLMQRAYINTRAF
jgi:hypothetical protein